jgi:hypothetical protein
MIETGAPVFVDTMVIIEAHRVNRWKELCGRYLIRTVEKCIEELATGNQRVRNPVNVDTDSLIKSLKPERVTESDIIQLLLAVENVTGLDDGEKHLLACAFKQRDELFFVCSPDKACMRVGYEMGLLDRFVSLEELLPNIRLDIQINYTAKWLDREKTKIKLGMLT